MFLLILLLTLMIFFFSCLGFLLHPEVLVHWSSAKNIFFSCPKVRGGDDGRSSYLLFWLWKNSWYVIWEDWDFESDTAITCKYIFNPLQSYIFIWGIILTFLMGAKNGKIVQKIFCVWVHIFKKSLFWNHSLHMYLQTVYDFLKLYNLWNFSQ